MIFQMHIELLEVEPPVWRKIQVKSGTNLHRLNLIIQRSMGWENSHLSEFEIDGKRYGATEIDDYGEGLLEFRNYNITQPLLSRDQIFTFAYDFGDGWMHEIIVEDIFEPELGVIYPRCIDGERACPPEDVGGASGYEEYLEAIMDPDHEEHENFMEWRGSFNPEKFDKDEVTKLMQKK